MSEFTLGANYWSRQGGPRMWTHFDREAIQEELTMARSIGLDTLRIFLYWPDFEPHPGVDSLELWDRVAEFLDLCNENQLKTFPTLLVGHMSGRNWDPVWRDGRDLWHDPFMVEHEEAFIRRSVSRLSRMPSVAGWVLTNEWPLYAGKTTPPIFKAWIERMTKAVREEDSQSRPITLGDGLWNALGADTGIQVQLLEKSVDIVGPHVYPEASDPLEVAMASYVHCAMGEGSRPVLLEEFGTTDGFGPHEAQADFYRSQVAGALMAGAVGAWAWCLTDFDLPLTLPYSHHPFELKFGLFTVDGKKKPTGQVMQDLRAIQSQFGTVEKDAVGIVVPALQTGMIPFERGPERELMTTVATRMLRTMAGLGYNPGVIREPLPPEVGFEDRVPSLEVLNRYQVLFLVAPRIGEPLRRRLFDWVSEGGHLYIAYSYTYWFPDLPAMLGVERDGLYNVQEFHEETGCLVWEDGTRIEFSASGDVPSVTLRESGATTLARDSDGLPRIFRRHHGRGTITTNSVGLEATHGTGPVEGLDDLYRAYFTSVDLSPRVRLEGIGGQAAVSRDGHVLVMNHGQSSIDAVIGSERHRVEAHSWWLGELPQ